MIGLDPLPQTDKDDVEEMPEIIGAQVDMTVAIKEAVDLPKQYDNIYAMYNMNFIGGENIKVSAPAGMTNRP